MDLSKEMDCFNLDMYCFSKEMDCFNLDMYC